MAKRLRRSSGFTLMELVVGIILSLILLMAVTAAYRTSLWSLVVSTPALPLAQAATAVNAFLKDRLAEANCVQWPREGQAASVLVAWRGQDCRGNVLRAEAPTFFVFCTSSEKRLLYREGLLTGTPSGALPCGPIGGSWTELPPSTVEFTAQFSRPADPLNVLNGSFQLFLPARPPILKERSSLVEFTVTLNAPLRESL